MAAEKLTKGRLAQILLMLVVLLTAFFWKTMKFESNQVIHCNLDSQCDFQIENHKVKIDQVGEGRIAIQSELPWLAHHVFAKLNKPPPTESYSHGYIHRAPTIRPLMLDRRNIASQVSRQKLRKERSPYSEKYFSRPLVTFVFFSKQ